MRDLRQLYRTGYVVGMTASFVEARCQIRPQRVALLIPVRAGIRTLEKAFDLFGMLWAGRYGSVLCVGNPKADAATQTWLARRRPEVVIGLALGRQGEKWRQLAERSCQPHVYANLSSKVRLPAFLRVEQAQLPTALEAAQHFADQRLYERFDSVIWSAPSSHPLSAYVKATFGIPMALDLQALGESWGSKTVALTGRDGEAEMVEHYAGSTRALSWLDVTSHGLDRAIDGDGGLASPPTIVVVSDPVTDLALYWNLRACFRLGAASRIIPVPRKLALSGDVVPALREWLSATPANATYVEVTSQSATPRALERFARRLRAGLRNLSPLKHVLVNRRDLWAASACGYERITHVPLEISPGPTRVVSVRCPAPELATAFRSGRRWCVDIKGDVRTGRALEGFSTGGRSAIMDVLRAPFPEKATHTKSPSLGESAFGITLRPKSADEPFRFALPSAQESLESLLLEAGLTVGADEKRPVYERALQLLGGLSQASRVLRGDSLQILLALAKQERMTVAEINREVKLGKKLRDAPQLPLVSQKVIASQPQHLRGCVRDRFERYFQREIYTSEVSSALFEKWTYHDLVSPQLRLGPCPRCKSTYWAATQADEEPPQRCVGCQESLSGRLVQKGFSINPELKLAIEQGLVPVVLTANYLRRRTTNSFLWLPGVKGELNGDPYDIDIFALCDGWLVLAECKGLEGVPPTRFDSEILPQFRRLVDVSKACRGQVVLLASLARRYPGTYSKFARRAEQPDMSVRLLRRADLERTPNWALGGEHSLRALLPRPKRKRRRKRKKKARKKNGPVYEVYIR